MVEVNITEQQDYEVHEPGGVPRYRVVVPSNRPYGLRLPSQANVGGILGVTLEHQLREGKKVPVAKTGTVLIESAGRIDRGKPVNIAGTTGRVKMINEHNGATVNVVGFADSSVDGPGQYVEVYLQPQQVVV